MSERTAKAAKPWARTCAAHRVEVAGERALRKRLSLRSASSQVKLLARARIRARPSLFVFCLHSFTRMPQVVVAPTLRILLCDSS